MALVPRRSGFGLRDFDDFFRIPDWFDDVQHSQLRGMAADVYETDDSVVVEMSVPGIKPEDININVTGDTLTVSGETKTEQEENDKKRHYYQKQLRYGSFAQTVSLPSSVDADKADANFEHGVLRISLPKSEAAKPKRIEIKSGK